MKNLKRIWKNYNKWEDWENGFFETKKKYDEETICAVKNILCCEKFFIVGEKLFTEWKNAIDHNLSYIGSNRKSYLGQAVCCYSLGLSAKTTAEIFTKLEKEDQKKANEIAERLIALYEEKYYEET